MMTHNCLILPDSSSLAPKSTRALPVRYSRVIRSRPAHDPLTVHSRCARSHDVQLTGQPATTTVIAAGIITNGIITNGGKRTTSVFHLFMAKSLL